MSTIGMFVGINYKGTEAELGGCINDAEDLESLFAKTCGYESFRLHEANATKERILNLLRDCVQSLAYRDLLFFSFSGHGTWIPDKNGDEPDGKDECLCPYDYQNNLIVDDELQEIFATRKRGSKIVFLSDSCHSGTVFRLAGIPTPGHAIRFIPPQRIDLGRKLLKEAEKREAWVEAAGVLKKENTPKSGLIHLSGCQDTEYSYDAIFDRRYNGAFTYHFMKAWKQLRTGGSWKELFEIIRMELPSYTYPQRPMLNATSSDSRSKVIGK